MAYGERLAPEREMKWAESSLMAVQRGARSI